MTLTFAQRPRAGAWSVAAVIIAVTLGLSLGSSPAQANINNGSFEAGLTSWTSVGGSGLVTTNPLLIDGTQSAQVSGTLSQSFAAVAGWTYSVSFQMRSALPTQQSLLVGLGFGSSILDTGTFLQHFNAPGGGALVSQGLTWTPTQSGNATLFIDSVQVNGGGGVIDNVVVSAVPEPSTWALLIAGLGVLAVFSRRRRAA
jgi:PEP-CTERM motif